MAKDIKKRKNKETKGSKINLETNRDKIDFSMLKSFIKQLEKPFIIATFPFVGYLCSYFYQFGKFKNYNLPLMFIKLNLEYVIVNSLLVCIVIAVLFYFYYLYQYYKRENTFIHLSLPIIIVLGLLLKFTFHPGLASFVVVSGIIFFSLIFIARITDILLLVGYFGIKNKKQELNYSIKGKTTLRRVIRLIFTLLLLKQSFVIETKESKPLKVPLCVTLIDSKLNEKLLEISNELITEEYKIFYFFLLIVISSITIAPLYGFYYAKHTQEYLTYTFSDTHKKTHIYYIISEYDDNLLAEDSASISSNSATEIAFVPISEKTNLRASDSARFNNIHRSKLVEAFNFISGFYYSVANYIYTKL